MWGVRDMFNGDDPPSANAVKQYVLSHTGREEPPKWVNELIGLARTQVAREQKVGTLEFLPAYLQCMVSRGYHHGLLTCGAR